MNFQSVDPRFLPLNKHQAMFLHHMLFFVIAWCDEMDRTNPQWSIGLGDMQGLYTNGANYAASAIGYDAATFDGILLAWRVNPNFTQAETVVWNAFIAAAYTRDNRTELLPLMQEFQWHAATSGAERVSVANEQGEPRWTPILQPSLTQEDIDRLFPPKQAPQQAAPVAVMPPSSAEPEAPRPSAWQIFKSHFRKQPPSAK